MARMSRLTACAALLAACCIALSCSSLVAARSTHPMFSAAQSASAQHSSRHIRALEVLDGFHITHGADKTPLAGFHPHRPAVPKPQPKQAKAKVATAPPPSVMKQEQQQVVEATFDKAASNLDIDLGDLNVQTRSEAEQKTADEATAAATAAEPEEQEAAEAEGDDPEFSDADLAHWSVHGAPHSYHKGQAQLFPDHITLHFKAFGESHALDMRIMRDLFNEHSGVEVFDANNDLVETRRHVLQSYWSTHAAAAGEWATATLHANGQFQLVLHSDGDTLQIDPVHLHRQEMDPLAYKKLHRASVHRDIGHPNTQKGLVAFKHSDQIDLHKTHKCGSMRPGQQHGNATGSSGGIVEEEPLLPYTAAARKLLQTATATAQGYGAFPDSSNAAGVSPWSGCFPSDTSTAQKLPIGFAVDAGMYDVWGSVSGVAQYIAWQMAVANLIYLTQLHIFLVVSDVVVQTALGASTPAWNDHPMTAGAKCATTIDVKLNTLSSWRGSAAPTRNALWNLQTNCYPPSGTVGLAWIGVLCNTYYGAAISTFSSNQWLTTAHEIGHNFNARHTFQLGQGTTGGVSHTTHI